MITHPSLASVSRFCRHAPCVAVLAVALAGTSGCQPRTVDWRPASPSPVARFEGPGVVVDDKLYVFGGFFDAKLHATERVDVYDPARDRWEQRADMPTAVTHRTPALDGTIVWFAGGFEGDQPGRTVADVWRYDLATDAWSPGPPLPAPRGGGALVRDGRLLHFFGGFAEDRDTTLADHWVLDLDGGDGWQPRAPLPEARGHLSALALDGRIYAIGGQRGHDKKAIDLDAVHVYDPATDRWTARAPVPTPRSHFEASTFVWNGEIVIAGGRNNRAKEDAMARVSAYDPRTDRWRELPRLPAALLGPVLLPIGGRLVLTTGSRDGWDAPQTSTFVVDTDAFFG